MPKSMTGYGRHFSRNGQWAQTWEIRSVNGKQFSLRLKSPPQTLFRHVFWERIVREHAARGRIDVSLELEPLAGGNAPIALDRSLASAMLRQVSALAREDFPDARIDASSLLLVPQAWKEARAALDEETLAFLDDGLAHALGDWDASRAAEGLALARDISQRMETCSRGVAGLIALAPAIKQERIARARERIGEVLGSMGVQLDESRMLQEIVCLSDRLDVSEELARFEVHLSSFAAALAEPGETGRKLDFLLQECFREMTTCGNKIQDTEAGKIVVDCKVELEKCREQAQNIE